MESKRFRFFLNFSAAVFALIVVNFGTISHCRAAQKLLIIAPVMFQETLQALKTHKNATGIPTTIITLEDIYTTFSGMDEPAAVKRAIALYDILGFKYVMLAGDVNLFPVRWQLGNLVDAQVNNDLVFLQSDFYYADLYDSTGAFNDWDADGDGYYGEIHLNNLNPDGMDFFPDVAVARVPAASIEELQRYIAKVIYYEYNTFGQDWFENILLVQKEWSSGIDSKETIADHFIGLNDDFTDYDFAVYRLYEDISAADYSGTTNGLPTTATITTSMNAGMGFLSHLYHGHPNEWQAMYTIPDIQSVDLYNERKLPVIYSGACQTTQFFNGTIPYCDYDDTSGTRITATPQGSVAGIPDTPSPLQPNALNHMSIAEAFLLDSDKGAIAYYGCQETGEPSRWEYAHKYLEQSFFTAYTPENNILGDMWTSAILDFAAANNLDTITPSGNWWATCKVHTPSRYILFGDPTLRVGGVPGLKDTAPVVTTDDADDYWHNEDVTVTLTAVDTVSSPSEIPSGVKQSFYTINGGDATPGSHILIPAPLTHANDGTHTLEYWSHDFAMNTPVTNSAIVKIDTVKPVTQISITGEYPATVVCPEDGNGEFGCPARGCFDGHVIVTLTASDDRSGLGGTAYNYDRWPYEAYTSPFQIDGFCGPQITDLEYFSYDHAGNREDMHLKRICITSDTCLSDMGIMAENARILGALKEILAFRLQKDFVSTLPPIKSVRYEFAAQDNPVNWTQIGTDSDQSDGWGVPWNTALVANGNYIIRLHVTEQLPAGAKALGDKNDKDIYTEDFKVQVCNVPSSSYEFKLSAPEGVDPADQLEFNIYFANKSGSKIENITLTCDLDPGLFENIVPGENGFINNNDMPAWFINTIGPGEEWSSDFQGTTQGKLDPRNIISAQAYLTADTIPLLVSDNPNTQDENDYTAVRIQPIPGSITGSVMHDQYGTPLSAVVLADSGSVVNETATDENGVYTFTGLPPGAYTVSVIADGYDYQQPDTPVAVVLAGFGQEFQIDFFLRYADFQAPRSHINQVPDDIVHNNITVLTGTASDPQPGSGLRQVEIAVMRNNDGYYWRKPNWTDKESWQTATGTADWESDCGPIVFDPALSYTFISRATDIAENVEKPIPISTTPAAPILTSPADGSVVTDARPAFDWEDVPGCLYILEVDNNKDFLSPEIHESFYQVYSTYISDFNLSKDTYYWRVKAVRSPRASQWSAVWEVAIDPPDPCEGDLTQDGMVNGDDLDVFSEYFGRDDCSPGSPCKGDFEPDGTVDGQDLHTMIKNFNRTDCL
jgi:hypothetical protein